MQTSQESPRPAVTQQSESTVLCKVGKSPEGGKVGNLGRESGVTGQLMRIGLGSP